MANDLTAWPIWDDVEPRLLALGVDVSERKIGSPGTFYGQIINAVVQEVTQKTKRQFVAGSPGEVRYYDGSGTGIQEVDEYITITSVQAATLNGIATISFSQVVNDTQNLYPKTRIAVFRGSAPSIGHIYLDHFPAGRQNMVITGTFGYGATIPADLWAAVADEAAARVARMALFQGTGRMKSFTDGDMGETYELSLPGDSLGWHQQFKEAITRYKKPATKHLNTAKRMI